VNDYYSIPLAAKICSVNRSTMRRWAMSGKIKSYCTPGGNRRILIEDQKKNLEDNQMPISINEYADKLEFNFKIYLSCNIKINKGHGKNKIHNMT
jgi:hypothetical protein